MNGMNATPSFAGMVAGLVCILPACNVPPPPDDLPLLQWVLNTAEFSTDPDSWSGNPLLIHKIDDINASTNEAFGQVARINFRFEGPRTTGLSSGLQNGWPSVDKNDAQLYDNTGAGERFYLTYLQDHRDDTYAFGVYWILGPRTSFPICGTQPKTLAFSYDGTQFADNQVPEAVKSRGIFVFAGWIHDVTQCSWYGQAGYPAINLYIRTHTHEMGHQRGDLTHSDERIEFHGGPIPSVNQGFDVMHSNALTNDLRRKIPVFDQHFEPAEESSPCFTLTCQDNLVCWRSITN